ncbi:MAG TPA: hypothetical protein VI757_11720 [Bacteroidia bacterium]|nr:hypothetical protein [Bacteroidia bacterium]
MALIEITKEEAHRLFPNYGIYFENESGKTELRCWWDKINGAFHQFPEAKKYYRDTEK